MIVTDDDRRRTLARYRIMRRTSPNPPAVVMGILRDCAADWVCRDVARGRTPVRSDVADWQAATDYCRSMASRPGWWWQCPR